MEKNDIARTKEQAGTHEITDLQSERKEGTKWFID